MAHVATTDRPVNAPGSRATELGPGRSNAGSIVAAHRNGSVEHGIQGEGKKKSRCRLPKAGKLI